MENKNTELTEFNANEKILDFMLGASSPSFQIPNTRELTKKEIVFGNIDKLRAWFSRKEKAVVDKIPMKAKVVFRKLFYKYRVDVRKNGNGSHLQIIFSLEPNWIGRRLGYKKDQKGYYKSGAGWERLFGGAHEGPIPDNFRKQLDIVEAKYRLAKNRI